LKVSICTTTARKGFVEQQARMIANQETDYEVEWVLVDFDFENRSSMLLELSGMLQLEITHVSNIRDDKRYFRDIARNRNKALAYATGDYVIFLDDFAVISKEFVERHVDVLKSNALSCGLMHRLEHPTDDALIDNLPKNITEARIRFPNNMGTDFRDRCSGNRYKASGISYTGNLGIPRVIFEAINGFDPRMESALEDCDFGLRADQAGFFSFFNPDAYTINLNTGGYPYCYQFDHSHDCEPFIKNANNHFWGDDKLEENEFIKVEFCDHYRIAHCKKCGAQGMIDPNELIAHKIETHELRVPEGLPGGLDTIKKGI
jgi:glycosyltransferase involved in cell wall biosynthesis